MKKIVVQILCALIFVPCILATSTNAKDEDKKEEEKKEEGNGSSGSSSSKKEEGKNGVGSTLAICGAIITGLCMCAMI